MQHRDIFFVLFPPNVRIDFEDPDKLLKQQEQEEQEYEHSIKQRILKSALNHVNEYGWTKKTLEAGK